MYKQIRRTKCRKPPAPFWKENYPPAAEALKRKLFPFLLEHTLTHNSIVALFPAEPIHPEVNEFDPQRNVYIKKYNKVLNAIVAAYDRRLKESDVKRIFLISANLKTVQGPDSKTFLLPDRFHLVKKDKPVATPVSISANLHVLINLICNRYQEDQSSGKDEDQLCCKSVHDASR